MSRRIEVELTSSRPDGTWTWRAAGAREPKGVLEASILPSGAKVGDVLRVDAEMGIDGIEITHVLPPKGERKEPERIELLGRSFDPVIQTLAPRREGQRRERREGDRPDRDRRPREGGRPGDRRDRPDRPAGERGERRDRPDRPAGERGERRDRPPRSGDGPRPERRERRERPPRPVVPEVPQRPKPKRLRPGRVHRTAVLASLPDEHKPIAEQLLRGGVPAVRQALQEQNEKLKAEGMPEIKPGGVLALAEELLPKVRVADWLDRADAALADLDELDLRDLRSVVVAAGDPVVARDESTRDLSAALKDGLARRQDQEHQEWLEDIQTSLDVGRSVRALRLSSRPPKAGVRFPPELGARLADAASASLTADASTERWVAVLDALAFSPVRGSVRALGVPAQVDDELRAAVTRLAPLLPDIARQFGIEPPPPGSRAPRPPRPGRKPGERKPAAAKPAKAPAPAAKGAEAKSAAPAEATATEETTPSEAAAPTDVVETAEPAQAEAGPTDVGAPAAATDTVESPAEAEPTGAGTAEEATDAVESAAEAGPADTSADGSPGTDVPVAALASDTGPAEPVQDEPVQDEPLTGEGPADEPHGEAPLVADEG